MLEQSVELYGERPAFEIKKNNQHYYISYNQYIENINSLSTAILNLGLSGARLAVCADNCYEYALTYLSVICSGNVIVPVDKELHPSDVRGILNAAGAEYIFCDKKHLSKLGSEAFEGITVICFGLERDEPGALSFDGFVDSGRQLISSGNALYKDVKHDPEALCTLLFTSGTTGISKGVMLCQRNFAFEIKAAMSVISISPDDCAISLLPLHHTFESSIILFFAPYCGAKITFCEGFKYVLRNMKEFNPTVFIAVPLILETVHKRILKEIRKKKHGDLIFKFGKAACKAGSKLHLDLRKIIFKEIQQTFGGKMRMIICGGAPIDPKIIEDFDSFGIQVVFGYGLTECAPLAIINNDKVRTTDSVGVPLPGVEAKIVNPDENGVGEVCVKGDMVMLGYYNNKEATDEVIDADGFFHTGDLGYTDGKGHYHLSGRCKNVIVTANGKNIYPEELEYHLDSNSLVSSSMVEEITDKHGDATVHAQIFPDIEALSELLGKAPNAAEIEEHVKNVVDSVNSRLPSFKHIKSFTVRENDFIRTTAQKIKREQNKS